MRRAHRRQAVLQSRQGASQPALQAPDLPEPTLQPVERAEFDQEKLARQTYLTIREAMAYLRRTNRNAFYDFLTTQRIPRCRMGRTVLLRRVDLDRAVAPAAPEPKPLRAVHGGRV